MRFECHVDSNPLTGLLFCHRSPRRRAANSSSRMTRPRRTSSAVERDCSVIRPQAGHLIFFDGSDVPALRPAPDVAESDVRIVAVMNFYTESCPESTRPPS